MISEVQLSHDDRVVNFREGLDLIGKGLGEIRRALHKFIAADLVGAEDLTAQQWYELHRTLHELEGMFTAFAGEVPPAVRPRSELQQARAARLLGTPRSGQRRIGVSVIPERVRQARKEAGLSLAEVAGGEVTRVAIWYIETGRTRPSLATLRLIAERTGKPIEFFMEPVA